MSASLPVAINTFGFSRWWESARQPNGVWTIQFKVYDSLINGPDAFGGHFCSANDDDDVTHRGLITDFSRFGGITGILQFLGNGLPTRPKLVTCSTLSAGRLSGFDYWDISHGAWWVSGAYWLLARYYTGSLNTHRVVMLRSDDDGTSWVEHDAANAPLIGSTVGGSINRAISLRRGSNTVDVFSRELDGFTCSLNTFNFGSKTWTGSYGSFNPGPATYLTPGNGIYRFPNGDIGVFYQVVTDLGPPFFVVSDSILYYQEYASGSWGPRVTISDRADQTNFFGNFASDPGGELLHVFYWDGDGTVISSPVYGMVAHGGSFTSNIFTFPAYTGTDGTGQPIIWNNILMLPYDNFADSANAVWTMPLGGSTFVREFIPVDSSDGGTPSCAYLAFGNPHIRSSPKFYKRGTAHGA